MHVLLYEWVTGGGLVDESGRLPASLLAEGSAMAVAIAADFLKLADTRVTVLRDLRLDTPIYDGCEILEVHSGTQRTDLLEEYAAKTDFTLAIAPEYDRHLQRTLDVLQAGNAVSLNASREFLHIASDKHRTATELARFDLPVPLATIHAADEERLPQDFSYPAVLKPLDGAGSQHTLLVESAHDEAPSHPWPRRLEQYIPGRAASVLFICGPGGATALPACWQHLSDDGRFQYRGGSIILQTPLAQRATELARRTLAALPPSCGFTGVDLILGEHADGSQDFVIEVNPRVTTSYVGIRAALKENLVSQVVAAARNHSVKITPRDIPIEFSADGQVFAR